MLISDKKQHRRNHQTVGFQTTDTKVTVRKSIYSNTVLSRCHRKDNSPALTAWDVNPSTLDGLCPMLTTEGSPESMDANESDPAQHQGFNTRWALLSIFNCYIYQHALSWIFLPPPTIVSLLIIYFLLKSQ